MKVLIVDGEPGLAAGLAAWLVENGWDAPGVATTSDEATDWINEQGQVDVLVTDVFIKPADGLTLRESLLPHLPKLKTIFISGYDVTEHRARMEDCPFLPKPVTGEAIDAAIRSLFETPAPKLTIPRAATPKAVLPPAATPKATPKAASPQAVSPQVATAKPANPEEAVPRVARPRPATPQAAQAQPGTPRAATPEAAQPRLATPKPAVAQAGTPQAKVPQAAAPKVARVSARPKSVEGVTGSGEVELPPDELVGMTIGEYKIEARIGTSPQGAIHRALQTNMGRHVRFYTLDKELAGDPAEIQRFISNASVKANVSHPNIFAVFEAGESDGRYFYSCEYLPCRSLRQIREAGEVPEVTTAVQIMKVVADAMTYFVREQITHTMLTDSSVLLTANNQPRLANNAAHQIGEEFTPAEEMARLGQIIADVLPESSQGLGVRDLAVSLASGETTFPGWPALGKAVADLEPKVAPEDAYKLDAQERAAIRMVEEAKKRQKKGMIVSSLISLALLAAALGSVYWFIIRDRGAKVRAFDEMVKIPGGSFVYQDGEKLELPTFYIDEYEVTIGQYAEFLQYLKDHPEEAEKFDHPEQPSGKSHVPEKWANEDLATGIMYGYYDRAKRWRKYHDAALDVNSPVFGVDWFDAYAYAKWKGRRLPTEQEWEKAARGSAGFLYPWGDEDTPTMLNSGNDTDRNPEKGGEIDGWDAWSPVDAVDSDKSMFGVYGMAGNVSEWTDSRAADPMLSSQEVPVIRGGNWRTPNDYALTRRVLKLTELQTDEALGFRTASDTPPDGSKK